MSVNIHMYIDFAGATAVYMANLTWPDEAVAAIGPLPLSIFLCRSFYEMRSQPWRRRSTDESHVRRRVQDEHRRVQRVVLGTS